MYVRTWMLQLWALIWTLTEFQLIWRPFCEDACSNPSLTFATPTLTLAMPKPSVFSAPKLIPQPLAIGSCHPSDLLSNYESVFSPSLTFGSWTHFAKFDAAPPNFSAHCYDSLREYRFIQMLVNLSLYRFDPIEDVISLSLKSAITSTFRQLFLKHDFEAFKRHLWFYGSRRIRPTRNSLFATQQYVLRPCLGGAPIRRYAVSSRPTAIPGALLSRFSEYAVPCPTVGIPLNVNGAYVFESHDIWLDNASFEAVTEIQTRLGNVVYKFRPGDLSDLGLSIQVLENTASAHGITIPSLSSRKNLVILLKAHKCSASCPSFVTTFRPKRRVIHKPTPYLPNIINDTSARSLPRRNSLSNVDRSHPTVLRDLISGALGFSFSDRVKIPTHDITRCILHSEEFDELSAKFESFYVRKYGPVPNDYGVIPLNLNSLLPNQMLCFISMQTLIKGNLLTTDLRKLARKHNVQCNQSNSKEELLEALKVHDCTDCPKFVGLLEGAVKRHEHREMVPFPPVGDLEVLENKIIGDVCKELTPEFIEEVGCSVCGLLTLTKKSIALEAIESKLHVLDPASHGVCGVTRTERASAEEPILEIKGPVYDKTCDRVCPACAEAVGLCLMPKYALANGNWIGRVPKELMDLSFAEKLLVARARQNRCVVRVRQSGMPKLAANAISWLNPTEKIYNKLPPPREDLESVLAILFVGSSPPTKEELKRIPLLVRHKKVSEAIHWLKLNHCDYSDIEYSDEYMNQYPDGLPPVPVEWLSAGAEFKGDADAAAVNDSSDDIGTETDQCEIAVQGLSAQEIMEFNSSQYKIKALEHLKTGKFMVVGHHEDADSIYNNPQLYPRLFPWLFPYGLGGVGNLNCVSGFMESPKPDVPTKDRVRNLLMYYDKRFQMDPSFALTAFNHQQIRDSTLGGFLLAKKSIFISISDRLKNIDVNVLESLARRMKTGYVQAKTEAEKLCLDVINDLDHVAYRVNGSLTSKKHQRNEIWSLIASLGTPSWFITFAPKDSHHPLCIYFADTKREFTPDILHGDDIRRALLSNNPVASARFFHKLVELFILHVLGWGADHPGLFGQTEGFYGTVEQQGRLTLHLHLLLWIRGAPSPQQIRDRLSDPNSVFQTELLKYLDSMHVGQPIDVTKDEVQLLIANKSPGYTDDPLQRLPTPPSLPCEKKCDACPACRKYKGWRIHFKNVVNHVLVVANLHNCSKSVACSDGFCKGRYPRECYPTSTFDSQTGHIFMKKTEPMINTVNPVLTYLMRCNTDVTSLRSGTAVKAVVGYVTDYTAKPALKAYSVADIIRSTLIKSASRREGHDELENSRKLITSGVNQLSARLGIGLPMASAYLLDFPDHYSSHNYIKFFWRRYVHHAENTSWSRNEEEPCLSEVIDDTNNNTALTAEGDMKVKLEQLGPTEHFEADESFNADSAQPGGDDRVRFHRKSATQFLPYSPVYDYAHRPTAYDSMSLYEWICRVDKKKITSSRLEKLRASYKTPLRELDNTTKRLLKENIFTEGHPQRETHDIRILPTSDLIVPDFLGGSVPRSDGGDREFYCRTILTIFKPWRSGKDLRQRCETWDESFTVYSFSPRQRELMAYFNEKYECSDAIDEHSKRKNADIARSGPEFLTEELVGELDDVRRLEQDIYADMDDTTNINWEEAVEDNKRYYKRFADMKEVHRMLRESGWLDESVDGIPALRLDLTQCPDRMSPSRWKSLLTEERKARLNKRNANMLTSNKARNKNKKMRDKRGIVRIVDKSYFTKDYSNLATNIIEHIDTLVSSANLNEEQERAFRIIVNHAASSDLEQLRMYLGGMGGTGKSRVLHTVIQFFKDRNESHRFIVMAPTGSAAALVNGSTFHSILGFGTGNDVNESETLRAKVKDRLLGVEYIFFDEVSMLSCHKLYKIAAKLSELNSNPSVPFGGINMIFAGDFAQLPPVYEGPSKALYSTTSEPKGIPTNTSLAIAIGRSLWHQITTVVILRQNMRQRTQTPRDAAFRTSLENMRYGACTEEDIQFLNSMVASKHDSRKKLAQSKFRYVSVLVTTNTKRDKINALGCERFAKENGQPLMSFYAVDERKDSKGGINQDLREHLWSLPHSFTEHKPGMLKLCKGMPILIKENVATECCVTNGAEAVVEDWTFHLNEQNKPVLETLFVRLINPPQNIQLAGLPVNVVPITPVSSTFKYTLPNGIVINIKRSHVPVLPNFAMTDYSSQGRTRQANVVSLGGSVNSLLSTYTMLSRSASADNTIIMEGFDPNPLQRGTLGHVRQEFREMEILNHITEMRYNKTLPYQFVDDRRSVLINLYRSHFGKAHVPRGVHPNLNWSTFQEWESEEYTEAFTLDLKARLREIKEDRVLETERPTSQQRDENEQLIGTNINSAINAKTSILQEKRKFENLIDNPNKRTRLNSRPEDARPSSVPVGFRWDSVDWSCSYDSVCFVLMSSWNVSSSAWKTAFGSQNKFCKILHQGFGHCLSSSNCINLRNKLRDALFSESPLDFPRRGANEISVIKVLSTIVKGTRTYRDRLACSVCSSSRIQPSRYPTLVEHNRNDRTPVSIQQWLDDTVSPISSIPCPSCDGNFTRITRDHVHQPFLVFDLSWTFHDKFTPSFSRYVLHSSHNRRYKLCGVIYFGGNHFTACVILPNTLDTWYNDGAIQGFNSAYVGNLNHIDMSKLHRHDARRAIAVIYTPDDE